MNFYNWFKSNNELKQFTEEIKNVWPDSRIQNVGRHNLDNQATPPCGG